MDLVSDYQGISIVSRPMDQVQDYPAATVPAAYVEVYWRARNPDDPATAWIQGPTVSPVASVEIPYNPSVDKNVEIAPMPYSAAGIPGYSSIDDCFADVGQTLIHQRETDAPVIGQMGDATTDAVTIGVSNYTSFARQRRVKIATAIDGSGHLVTPMITIFDSTPDAPPAFIDFSRGTGPQTIYVAVSHSSGDGTRWTPDSNILMLTFASSEGTASRAVEHLETLIRDGATVTYSVKEEEYEKNFIVVVNAAALQFAGVCAERLASAERNLKGVNQ
jgi:hypothetical protein